MSCQRRRPPTPAPPAPDRCRRPGPRRRPVGSRMCSPAYNKNNNNISNNNSNNNLVVVINNSNRNNNNNSNGDHNNNNRNNNNSNNTVPGKLGLQ